jgi:intraflagellar transport protein 172
VWYSIDAPDRVTLTPIKGQVEDIVRANGVTTVIVDEGNGPANYDLEEGLIEFGTAMEDKDYDRAADFLESMHMSPEIEAMWKNLSELVMQDQQYLIAERCFAALGNISKARYLRKLHKELRRLADSEEEQEGAGMGIYHWKIRAKLAMLDKDFKTAEQIFLEQGKV